MREFKKKEKGYKMAMKRFPKYMIQATANGDESIWHDSADTFGEARSSAKSLLSELQEAGIIVDRCDVFGCDENFENWSPDPIISLVKVQ